jgi:hypothetical protein
MLGIGIAKTVSVHNQIIDKEYWNLHFTRATYTEFWQTWVHETCSRCTSHDKNGNCTHTESYDCSHCDDHAAHWDAMDNNGHERNISQSKYQELVALWHNENKQMLNRHIIYHQNLFGGKCGQDGNAFFTVLKNDSLQNMSCITEPHEYENRIKFSKNVFSFQPVDSADKHLYELYNYPSENLYDYNPILGGNDIAASKQLNRWNAKISAIKKCHLLICIYKNKSNDAATKQEAYWKGGNKNEVVLCIGINDQNKIIWTYVFSWTDNQLLKIELRDKVLAMNSLNLLKIVDFFGNTAYHSHGAIKKSFKQFSYITVEPTTTAIIVAFFITLILTIGLCLFGTLNPFDAKK